MNSWSISHSHWASAKLCELDDGVTQRFWISSHMWNMRGGHFVSSRVLVRHEIGVCMVL